MGDVVLYVDELESNCAVSHCRICHEAEFESCKILESPCSCSGTVKFAHRDCIQRWCNEKGNTNCEICLKNYEPGYTATSKKSELIDVMTIRESLEIPRREQDIETDDTVAGVEVRIECSSASDRSVLYCRILALTLTIVLLLKHTLATITGGTEDYPFTLLTILVLRASGILLPMFVVVRTISALRKSARTQYQDMYDERDEYATSTLEGGNQQHLI
ncbi:RING/FYVE/PHD zinc finger superfamily protein [Euphorbia peplus]|nr:RING/FYVE/PHD zinc finger superfamily protein [Euphorbia peplus]